VIGAALLASASSQVRTLSTMGGKLLQRTRCGSFRDTAFTCNKRVPRSGCPTIQSENRWLAILGVSEHGIATRAAVFAVALTPLDTTLRLRGANDARRILKLRDVQRLPGATPQIDTVLTSHELIDAIVVGHAGRTALALPESA
jgi:xanthine dehydrogenase YagS FAD-binding subunit